MPKNLDFSEPLLREIGLIADQESVQAFVVGGYVRDVVLGKQVKEIDIVVLGNGIEFASRVGKTLGASNVVTFENFGTAMVQLGEYRVEFVGARKESYSKNSRKPFVEAGTLQEDLSRRDFTVNALAVSLNKEEFGSLYDPFGGQKDIGEKILKTPLDPKTTFSDDPLRIMRAFRFASQLGFKIENTVLLAAQEMRERLKIVSQERISNEFLKIVMSPCPSVGFRLMFEAGVLDTVLPEFAQLSGVDQRQDHHHKDVFLHTLMVLDNIAETTDNLWLRIAAVLHDIAKPRTKAFQEGVGWTFHGHEEIGARMVKPIFKKMKFPLEHVHYVEKLVRLHLRPMALVDGVVTDSAVRRLMFEAGPDLDDLMKLCRADVTSKNPKLVEQVKHNYDSVIRKMEEVDEKDRIRNWQPPLRGEEIMQICGLEPGPAVGKLKDAITEAILDGRISNDHDAALTYLLEKKDELLSVKEQ